MVDERGVGGLTRAASAYSAVAAFAITFLLASGRVHHRADESTFGFVCSAPSSSWAIATCVAVIVSLIVGGMGRTLVRRRGRRDADDDLQGRDS
ncbi:MAG: hypothetical protein INR66_25310 [Gordonia polyisoprenivorans]|nr:hypothetical protein [Gordonia polyisoprenivorans]